MMKVVLFCGGLGMRMREGVNDAPKPMALIGDRPLLWAAPAAIRRRGGGPRIGPQSRKTRCGGEHAR